MLSEDGVESGCIFVCMYVCVCTVYNIRQREKSVRVCYCVCMHVCVHGCICLSDVYECVCVCVCACVCVCVKQGIQLLKH